MSCNVHMHLLILVTCLSDLAGTIFMTICFIEDLALRIDSWLVTPGCSQDVGNYRDARMPFQALTQRKMWWCIPRMALWSSPQKSSNCPKQLDSLIPELLTDRFLGGNPGQGEGGFDDTFSDDLMIEFQIFLNIYLDFWTCLLSQNLIYNVKILYFRSFVSTWHDLRLCLWKKNVCCLFFFGFVVVRLTGLGVQHWWPPSWLFQLLSSTSEGWKSLRFLEETRDLWMEKPLVLDVSKCGFFFCSNQVSRWNCLKQQADITDKFWWKKDHVGATNLDNQL